MRSVTRYPRLPTKMKIVSCGQTKLIHYGHVILRTATYASAELKRGAAIAFSKGNYKKNSSIIWPFVQIKFVAP